MSKLNNKRKTAIWQKVEKPIFIFCGGEKTEPNYFNGFKYNIESNAIYKADSLNEQSDNVKYHIAWSNECIEIWFLLHFCYYTQNNGRNNYFEKLNEIFKEKKLVKYEKNNKDIFGVLLEHGNPKDAINFAKKLEVVNNGKTPADSVPETKVYKLVESLLIYLPENIKNIFVN